MSKSLETDIISAIRKSLGLSAKNDLSESYVTQAKKYNLPTEFLSQKSKTARQLDLENHVNALNDVSARLDVADREGADKYASEFRRLKTDEVHNLNASFFRALHFENISDLRSQITMDSMTFLRFERDFGTFDDWQKDFIACAMSSRSGYVMTGYSMFLQRYMNFIVDTEALHVPIGVYPIIVLDVAEGSYYRDYLDDRKTYVTAMMKEFNWEQIEERVKKTERIAKVLK